MQSRGSDEVNTRVPAVDVYTGHDDARLIGLSAVQVSIAISEAREAIARGSPKKQSK